MDCLDYFFRIMFLHILPSKDHQSFQQIETNREYFTLWPNKAIKVKRYIYIYHGNKLELNNVIKQKKYTEYILCLPCFRVAGGTTGICTYVSSKLSPLSLL